MKYLKHLTRTVWILSLVSMFTDTASEMLYPVMPIYLQKIGFSVLLIGILEGVAEAVSGLSKGYFGELSDASGRRVPFVRAGYFLSALSKPLMAAFVYPLWIFFVRTLDRFGKGIRTGARDAILSGEATPETKGRIFGFHRSMDTLGAVFGPALALIFLYFFPGKYRILFLIAFIPGILAVISSSFLIEKKQTTHNALPVRFLSFFKYLTKSPPEYRKLVTGLLIFTLINSSDVFLLLKAKEAGLTDTTVIGAYIFYNLVYALFSFPVGILADRFGLKRIFISGLLLFSAVYSGMALNSNLYIFFLLFFIYGIFAAATEGISKAWISNISAKEDTATAIGTFTALQSICTMLASSLAGLIWLKYGSMAALLITGIIAIAVVIYFISVPKAVSGISG